MFSLGVADGPRGSWTPSCSPRRQNQGHNIINTSVLLHASENRGPISSHQFGVAVHDLQRSANMMRDVNLVKPDQLPKKMVEYEQVEPHLVHNQEVRLGNPRATFARNFIASLVDLLSRKLDYEIPGRTETSIT